MILGVLIDITNSYPIISFVNPSHPSTDYIARFSNHYQKRHDGNKLNYRLHNEKIKYLIIITINRMKKSNLIIETSFKLSRLEYLILLYVEKDHFCIRFKSIIIRKLHVPDVGWLKHTIIIGVYFIVFHKHISKFLVNDNKNF